MTPLELAIVLSAVDNASRAISQIQEKLEGLAAAGERMRAIGEGMTFAGGLIRAARDARGLDDATRAAMSFQDAMPLVNALLPPPAEGFKQLAQIREFAIAQSQLHAYAAKDVAESVYIWLSGLLSARQAMAAARVAEQVVIVTHRQLADVMRTLATLCLDFGDKTKPTQAEFQRLGDTLTTLQTQFAVKDMGEITPPIQYATSAAKPFPVPLNTALAAIASFSATGMHGSEAGTASAEMVNAIGRGAFEKLGIPLAEEKDGTPDLRASLGNLAVWIRAHADLGSAEKLTRAAGIRGARAELLIQQLGKLDSAQKALAIFAGAAARAQQVPDSTTSERFQMLKNNLEAVAEKVADQVLPALARRVDHQSSAANAVADFLARHQTIATVLADSAGTLGGLTAGAGAFLLTLGPVVWKAVAAAEAALGKLWLFVKDRGPQLLLMLAAPWAMLPYEIYKRLDQIAAGKVAHTIARFFVGHSPIPEGPLPDLNLSRAIAMTLRPEAVMVPTNRTARAIGAAMPPSIALRGGITVNYSPNISISGNGASSKDEWVKAAHQHADELVRIIEAKLGRRARLEFA
jgi:TP901 family phage tail tape measure protein